MFAAHGEAALFRRFDGLNLRNILYMQAELVHLEAELHHIERQDRSSSDPTQAAHPLSVYDLKELASAGKSAQWSKHQEIQMKLQAYSMYFHLFPTLLRMMVLRQITPCCNMLLSASFSSPPLSVLSFLETGWIGLKVGISS